MKCSGCDHENRVGAKFCEECAVPLGRNCAGCGAELRATAKFCDECAAPVTGPAPSRSNDPRSYTPKHLVEKILTSRSALEGERKQVTVLFADVKGSMDLAEHVDPEVWHGILDRFFQILTEGVHRFEGTVNQYTGDGIMALFGAPIAHEDHAQRACYAALHLRDGLRDLARDVKRRHGVDFATRIGLNSGEVIVGKIGDDLRMDYTAQGHTVGLAQRMEALASGGSIYMTPDTALLVAGYFEHEDLGEFSVKGVSELMHVFELRGAGRARTRAGSLTHVSRAGGNLGRATPGQVPLRAWRDFGRFGRTLPGDAMTGCDGLLQGTPTRAANRCRKGDDPSEVTLCQRTRPQPCGLRDYPRRRGVERERKRG